MSLTRKRKNSDNIGDNVAAPKHKSKPYRKRPQSEAPDEESEVLKPKRTYKKFDKKDAEEEERLSKFLFGGSQNFLKSLEDAEAEVIIDSSGTPDSGLGEDDIQDVELVKNKPAWVDEDDDGIDVSAALKLQKRKVHSEQTVRLSKNKSKYKSFLEQKFESVNSKPKWATEKSNFDSSDEDLEEDTIRTCGFIRTTVKQNLASGSLEFKKVKDLNHSTKCEGLINSIEFHPKSTAGLVAGTAGIMSLFAVDGKNNHKLHSVSFEKFPIKKAAFIKDGNEAILGSNRSHFYTFDLLSSQALRSHLPYGLKNMKNFVVSPDSKYLAIAGVWGEVHLLSALSKERLITLKQDNLATNLIFNQSSDILYGHSDSGEVTVWDMRTMRVRHKWIDVGCLHGTSLGISSSNQFLAGGSMQGVVNLYGVEDILAHKMPKARKSIFNLTTSINNMKFNSTSEILAFSSQEIENSIRLFHVGSGSVFSNFPRFGKSVGSVTALNFSPNSGYFATGNTRSGVQLYHLKHFKNY